MAIGTYTELQNAVLRWVNTPEVEGSIPDFIALAEARLNRDIRHPEMMARATSTLTNGYASWPSDFSVPYLVSITGDDPLDYISPLDAEKYLVAGISGNTRYYTIEGDQLHVIPEPTVTSTMSVELRYWRKIPALSSNSTNWLLTRFPDVYLYGALTAAGPFLADVDKLAMWLQEYNRIVEQINLDGERAMRSQTQLVRRFKSF